MTFTPFAEYHGSIEYRIYYEAYSRKKQRHPEYLHQTPPRLITNFTTNCNPIEKNSYDDILGKRLTGEQSPPPPHPPLHKLNQ